MDIRFISVVVVACQMLMNSSPLLAGDDARLLTGAQKKAYHACLYASFIDDYCRFHAWGSTAAAFRECVIAQGAGRIPPGYPFWGLGVNDACRALVEAHRL
jgi:hypothetical protein